MVVFLNGSGTEASSGIPSLWVSEGKGERVGDGRLLSM